MIRGWSAASQKRRSLLNQNEAVPISLIEHTAGAVLAHLFKGLPGFGGR